MGLSKIVIDLLDLFPCDEGGVIHKIAAAYVGSGILESQMIEHTFSSVKPNKADRAKRSIDVPIDNIFILMGMK